MTSSDPYAWLLLPDGIYEKLKAFVDEDDAKANALSQSLASEGQLHPHMSLTLGGRTHDSYVITHQ